MTLAPIETLQSLVDALSDRGDQIALVQFDQAAQERWSYEQLDDCVTRLAAGLCSEGVKAGDRAILFAPNSPQWVFACLSLLKVGAIPVLIDSQSGKDDLAHILEDCGASWLFTTPIGMRQLEGTDVSHRLRVVLLERGDDRAMYWRELFQDTVCQHAIVAASDCAILFYTSGTTGPPKGVPLSHHNLISNIQALTEQDVVRADDRVLLPLPLHHVYPFVIGLLVPLYIGLTVIFPRSLLGPHFLLALRRGEATVLLGVPRLASALLAAIEQGVAKGSRQRRRWFRGLLRLSVWLRRRFRLDAGKWIFAWLRGRLAPRLYLIVSGGAALEPEVAWKLEGLGWRVASGYGLTETSPILTFNPPGARRPNCAGKPLTGVQLRIAPTASQKGVGEVLAKGPNVFVGYRNLPEKTREAFTEDGWFRTGDLGFVDSRGDLHLTGRTSSMIVLADGKNIDPEKLEALLETSSLIAEAGVLEHGGRLIGIVVPERELSEAEDDGTLEQILRGEVTRLSTQIPSYQTLNDIVVDRAPLPRTRLGKLRRHLLPARCTALVSSDQRLPSSGIELLPLSAEDRQLLEEPVASRLWVWLGERYPDHVMNPDTRLGLDLGVDSLEWLNLTLEIRNRAGVELSDEAVGRILTVRDLLREAAVADQAVGMQEDVLTALRQPGTLLDDNSRRWFEPRPWRSAILDPLAVFLARAVMRLPGFRVEGLENLPGEGPCVLTPNHRSALDPIAVAAAIGSERLRVTYWGGWVGILFRSTVMSALSHAVRVLPVDPQAGPLSNLALASTALHNGHSLVWFPEGSRSPTGEQQRFRSGIGLLLSAHDVPTVPVWIQGTREALPPGRLWPKRNPVLLRFGKPVSAEQLEREGSGNSPEERIAGALHARVRDLAHGRER